MPYHLYAFGSNGESQLGLPAEDIVSTPTQIPWEPTTCIKTVRGGDNHTLIISDDRGDLNTIYRAGDNRKAQFGIEPTLSERYVDFEKHTSGISLCSCACESSAYIINGDDEATISTEGQGLWGELGRGGNLVKMKDLSNHPGSLELTLPSRAIDFAAGVWHYIIILENGQIWGWGKSRNGQLGKRLSSTPRVTIPTKLELGSTFKPEKVACGKDFTYIASDPTTGSHTIFGPDKFGLKSNMPAHVKGWKYIGATWHAVFVLFENGSLTAWGKENMWKLIPPELPLIDKLAVGSDHVLAVTREGKLISWGWGKHGNCGDLEKLKTRKNIVNDMVNGFWNEIEDIPGEVYAIGAGYCTSFVSTIG